jgi:pyruvate formate lyase activating enzyme
MKEAHYYSLLENNSVRCGLCPHNCDISDGHSGLCKVRKNLSGKLISLVYGKPVSIHSDPVEKKPLYHFFPGHQVLSIGTLGCNLKCKFCQNFEISQVSSSNLNVIKEIPLEEIIEMAVLKERNIGLAYTYNEPIIFFEYMTDLARRILDRGMKNVMVSNGYINPKPLQELLEIIHAFNIDLKSFNDEFYRIYTKSSLNPVLETISTIAKSGRHLELTFLAIPGLNDNIVEFEKMTDWISDNCSRKTVLHISRYFPKFQMNIPPTPSKTLEYLYLVAKKKLTYVYLGNVQDTEGQDTVCPGCNKTLITRNGYYTTTEGLSSTGKCKYCQEVILTEKISI